MSAPQSAAPGWYPDPSGAPGQRYFDGTNWTVTAPPPPPAPAPKKGRKWPWIVGGVVVLLIVIGLAGGNKEGEKPASATVATKAPQSGGGGAPAEKAAPGVGSEVRDGKFEFIVSKIDVGQSVVGRDGNQFMQKKAQGEWAVLSMTVTNIGDKPQTFFAENQKLIAGGKTFSADSTASSYLVDDSLMTEINPGNKIDVQVAFDVPVGTEPDQVKLHDSAFSGGVAVNLKRTS
ncbi:Mpr protein [Mycobacteroides abscessus subsp. abscessus]|uniref:DUF4352 domain-containing protein n=1 Tax=Mycobacteroides abscessus TaxID=36809 RepID=UPI0009A89D9B|nr:DUF4352 domain-containing protein [Mycobacteroides abscessus]QSM05013.1 YcdA-like lipoprotein [Mycobacterium phage prophiGD12-2]MBN7355481.1 DUF4352 domain-containing protein [Mycobacteroides abscessus subsp. abscessus]MBN7360260.1 DUF4352 domain-containing protein [Mycobacteroides abscessus subsp. abscessus]MBN7474738.1 DUF4352 domain-containing protein [Mycobacteroides abscessus subsp. abscessus]SLI65726.1 Mpr protein [Mycobacteroides abscessus subsp. abscessus]